MAIRTFVGKIRLARAFPCVKPRKVAGQRLISSLVMCIAVSRDFLTTFVFSETHSPHRSRVRKIKEQTFGGFFAALETTSL
ncbi:MAG: hypothetical protein C4516_07495 [Oxalobacter sp.]|nr:MAG: hypothetical protein C4516_07495 [Oxalobacter sp.]